MNAYFPVLAGLLAAVAAPSGAVTPVLATFTFALFDENSNEVGPLTVELGFDAADAALNANRSAIIFPADSGEGVDLATLFRFSGAGIASQDLGGLAERYRSVFFDVATTGPVFDPVDDFQVGTTSFSDYAVDGGGCLVGLTSGLFGLGGDAGGDCRYLTFDSAIMNGAGRVVLVQDGTATPMPSVPEPATWGMMALGFGLIGAAQRQKKDQRSPTRRVHRTGASRCRTYSATPKKRGRGLLGRLP